MKIDVTDSLNSQQAQAVLHEGSPLLILAGAGSGKTKVLTHRITHFVANKQILSQRILGVTFTNKAANEMKERIIKVAGSGFEFPFLGTFHSICVRILRADGRYVGIEPSFTIYDSEDQKDLIKQILKDLNIDPKELNPNAIHWAISNAKNNIIDYQTYRHLVSDYFTERVADIYPLYQTYLAERNAVDFDDLILKTIELFEQNKQVAEKYIDKFEHIFVDEYQDTNKAQYKLIKILAQPKQNITVVGDEDQSIYGWRGADIQNILSFEEDFKNSTIIKLEQNYRSTQIILDAAYAVINKNTQRRDKKLWSDKKTGPKISIVETNNEISESKFIVQQIQSLNQKYKIPYHSIAVLYRANAQSRNIEEQMIRHRIPYRLVGGMRFYERKEIKDVLSYLRVIYNSSDTLSLQRVINNPTRGIGPKTISDLIDVSKALQIPIVDFIQNLVLVDNFKNELSEYNDNKAKYHHPNTSKQNIFTEHTFQIDEFFESLNLFIEKVTNITEGSKLLQNKNVIAFGRLISYLKDNIEYYEKLSDYIKFVLEESGYLEYINDRTTDGQNRVENIKELIGMTSKYDNLDTITALSKFLEEVSLIEDIQEMSKDKTNLNAVNLMTLHAAKGLEFDAVFIPGMEEGIFPHSRSLADPQEMEEERRLAYVGITRAKQYLYLIYTLSRTYFGNTQSNNVSRFISDIPAELVDFIPTNNPYDILNSSVRNFIQEDLETQQFNDYIDIGDRVIHPTFGEGKVIDIENDVITVDFLSKGKTKLIAQFAKLKKIKS
ncbi:MAG: DNA helicase [Candidatus Dojkabacteria bacterium]|nr:MAG: DNA helicase [Candidatus Dojkabacteria bacterium]